MYINKIEECTRRLQNCTTTIAIMLQVWRRCVQIVVCQIYWLMWSRTSLISEVIIQITHTAKYLFVMLKFKVYLMIYCTVIPQLQGEQSETVASRYGERHWKLFPEAEVSPYQGATDWLFPKEPRNKCFITEPTI